MNTPIQTLTSNLDFLQSSVAELGELVEHYTRISLDEAAGCASTEALRSGHKKAKDRQIDYILDDAPKAIQESKSGISHISLVVKAMRDFTNRQEAEPSLIDFNAFIAEEAASLRRGLGAGIELECRLAKDDVRVVAEKPELGRALQYIVDNAVWAIRDAEKQCGRVTVSTWSEGGRAVVEITDDGIGMDTETLKKAFDPFFTTREVGRGIGQGLTIAHHIVKERNGGEIEVSSTPGAGTAVTISLPLRDSISDENALGAGAAAV